jgi:hypothetical protein
MVDMDPRPYATVLVADVIGSRQLSPPQRRALQARVRSLAKGAAFRFTGGDEFEWRLSPGPGALDAVLLLRARLAAGEGGVPGVQLRCGLGIGRVDVEAAGAPYAEDGPAFHRARRAYERTRAKAGGRRRADAPFAPAGEPDRRTAIDDGRVDPVRDALLAHMDARLAAWTPAQWQAIAKVLEGLRYEAAGAALGVSAQNVSKRLKAAGLDLYLSGHAALRAAWPEEGSDGDG